MARKPQVLTENVENGEIAEDATARDLANAGTPGSPVVETPPEGSSPVIYTETAISGSDVVRAGNGLLLRIKKRVAMPSLNFLENMTIIVRIVDPIRRGEQVVEVKPGKAAKEPGFCCTIASLAGDQRILWCGAVLAKELQEQYPAGDPEHGVVPGYVGLWFHITRLPKKRSKEGNEYSPYVINEIFPPTASEIDAYTAAEQRAVQALAAPQQAA